MPRNLVILGSTGSIGTQTLEIAAEFPEEIRVVGLAAQRNVDLLAQQAANFRPQAVAIGDVSRMGEWNMADIPAYSGVQGMVHLASDPEVDIVVVATVGAAGLMPTLGALKAGKLVALANKETLVMAGEIIRREWETGGGSLVPIDSEHSAIWQCLQGEENRSIERITLTASGGALRKLPIADLVAVTPEQALRHPTWNMGQKVTIDSATLMNKGLEVMEARWLFDIPMKHIDVVLHEQSIVHSLVTFDDSSTKAQLGLPDMKLPIQYALSHPHRWPNTLTRLDLAAAGVLTFGSVDMNRYPALRLALQAGESGGTYPAVLCAADEMAVDAFLAEAIGYTAIPEVLDTILQKHNNCPNPQLDDILRADDWARATAADLIATKRPT